MRNKRTRAQRKADRRAKMVRAERVPPSELAERKKRPWPMQVLLHRGPEGDGLDADEFEAALQIVEAFKIVTVLVGERRQWSMEHIGIDGLERHMTEGDARRWTLWFAWSTRLPRGLPVRLVEWIEDRQPIGSVAVLRKACRLWSQAKRDQAEPPQDVDKPIAGVLKLGLPELCLNERTGAKPVFLPAQPFSLPGAPTTHPPRLVATVAQACAAPGPSFASHNAVTATAPPTARPRR